MAPETQILTAYAALNRLPQTRCLALSPLYRSRAIGPPQPDYLNAVAKLTTGLAPLSLLDALQSIEHAQKRVRREHWGPRTIDLDILLIDDLTLNDPRLTVPHPYLTQRNFVLAPLRDLEPTLVLPGGQSVDQLLQKCGTAGLVKLPN